MRISFQKNLRKNKIHFFVVLFIQFLIISGCFSINRGSSGHIKKYFETFYISPEITQYYIKPIHYKRDDKSRLTIDFTFRDSSLNSPVRVNFSLLINEPVHNNPKKVSLQLGNNKEFSGSKIYFDHQKKYKYRYGGFTTYKEFKKFVNQDKAPVTLTIDEKKYTFYVSSMAKKHLKHIRSNVIQSIEFSKGL